MPDCLATRRIASKREKGTVFLVTQTGAGNGVRTRDTKLGKLVLYQLSYARSRFRISTYTHLLPLSNFFRGNSICSVPTLRQDLHVSNWCPFPNLLALDSYRCMLLGVTSDPGAKQIWVATDPRCNGRNEHRFCLLLETANVQVLRLFHSRSLLTNDQFDRPASRKPRPLAGVKGSYLEMKKVLSGKLRPLV